MLPYSMPIDWTAAQRGRVEALLVRFRAATGGCQELAHAIHPIACERDRAARMWRLLPAVGRYVVPKIRLEHPWYFHVTTETQSHFVDALTGIDGTSCAGYLETHWTETDAIRWIEEAA